MGAVQVQILGPQQGTRTAPRGTRMAPTRATKLATTTASSTETGSRLATSLLSLLLLPLCQALPQPAESQNWLARSTCVLDALAPGGVVDLQKFTQCMDCWRSSSDESLQTATTCLSSLPQFCKEDETEDGAAGPLLCVEDWELPSMQQQQICLLDWALLLSQGKQAIGAGVVLSTSSEVLMGLCSPSCQPTGSRPRKGAALVVVCFILNRLNNKMPTF